MSAEQVMVPTDNWLGSVALNSLTTVGDLPEWSSSWYQPSWWPYYYPVSVSTARPIRLTMAEIEQLRLHARGNPTLKAILQKFTAQIEILVEFD